MKPCCTTLSTPARVLCAALALSAGSTALAADEPTFAIEPSARLHQDYASHQSDVRALADGWSTRRATLGLQGRLARDWSFELAYELASKGDIDLSDGEFKDAYVAYQGWGAADITVGQFKLPFGLDELTSSNHTSLIERALPVDAFAPSRRLGLGLNHVGAGYTLSAMAFGSDLAGDHRGRGLAARATMAPLESAAQVLHLGLAAVSEKPRGKVDFDAAPESRVADVELVNTGRISDVRRTQRLGLEAAWRSGPLLLQGEWLHAAVRRGAGRPDAQLGGWYLAASWALTGEVRAYKQGRFKGLRPSRSSGAWELAARYSRIDLDDASVRGGREGNLTLGLNYYYGKHLRLMLNYIRVHSVRRNVHDDPRIVQLRAQLAF